jgi:hypothetical protein
MSALDRAFRLIVETLSQLEKERVGPLDAVPPMVDIAVSLALAAGGVDVAEEILGHVRKRIDDYRDGQEQWQSFPLNQLLVQPASGETCFSPRRPCQCIRSPAGQRRRVQRPSRGRRWVRRGLLACAISIRGGFS